MSAMSTLAKRTILRTILFGLAPMLNVLSAMYPALRAMLRRHNAIAQIQLKDGSIGRHFIVRGGRVRAVSGLHPKPDVVMMFKDVDTALTMMQPKQDMGEIVHAAKNFKVQIGGPDPLSVWWMQTLAFMMKAGLKVGTPQRDGSVRYTNLTNGGPLFVYVRNGRILRVTPIDFDAKDAPSWTIQARGRQFTPRRQGVVAPHALAVKSTTYSDRRLLYPMKRVDFDPNGARNPHNRGISKYERISWDEALTIVANEIRRQKRTYGAGIDLHPDVLASPVGKYRLLPQRTDSLRQSDRLYSHGRESGQLGGLVLGCHASLGHSQRVGVAGNYGTVEDCLQNAEQIVFWSSDPESTNGAYAGFESTQRRMWAQVSSVFEFIHIDPHYNPTAQLLGGRWIPIRPATDAALAIAIMYVWIKENLYDADYVRTRTTGFDEWRAYVMGESDGVPKTPEWQEPETGVPAKDVRALARLWAKKKTLPGLRHDRYRVRRRRARRDRVSSGRVAWS